MKQLKRKPNVWKATNLKLDTNKMEAYSYGWWCFLKKIEGGLVFNNHFYSVTTRKHQGKVKGILHDLGIKIDIELPFKAVLQYAPDTLKELYELAEIEACNTLLENEYNKRESYLRRKYKLKVRKLEDYLESSVHFRDYEIRPKSDFGVYNKIAIHQVVDDIERDVENAIYNFHRDGFGNIIFYVGV